MQHSSKYKFTLIDPFLSDHYLYITDKNIASVRLKLEEILQQKEIFDFKYNLIGEIDSNNYFKLTRRMGLWIIKSWEGDPVTIYGNLKEYAHNNTIIEVVIKPNFIFIIFFIITLIISIVILLNLINNFKLINIGCTLLPLMFSLILWFSANFTKKYHKCEFEKSMDLLKNNEIVKKSIRL